jgi:hypothetical protein
MIRAGMEKPTRKRSGQAMVEFMVVLMTCIVLFVAMGVFLRYYMAHHYRVVNLIASEYP